MLDEVALEIKTQESEPLALLEQLDTLSNMKGWQSQRMFASDRIFVPLTLKVSSALPCKLQ